MSAHQQMKRMLDALMGTGRNGEVGKDKVEFHHQRVCKTFLLDCCPHDVLSATRCDLGRCPKVHDFALRADYHAAIKTKDYDYNAEVLQTLRTFISETERRTQIAKQRLAETQQSLEANESIRTIQMQTVQTKIEETLATLTKLAEEGKVEETMNMMTTLETLKAERKEMEKEYRIYVPNSKTQQQNLRVCTTCASYLGFDDNDERLADHFKGRMHLGYMKIRNMIDELETAIQEKHIRQFLDQNFKSSSGFMANSPSLQVWSGIYKPLPTSNKNSEKRKQSTDTQASEAKKAKTATAETPSVIVETASVIVETASVSAETPSVSVA